MIRLFFLVTFFTVFQSVLASEKKRANLPSTEGFIENRGQFTDSLGKNSANVLYKIEAPNMLVYLTKWGLTYYFIKNDITREVDENSHDPIRTENKTGKIQWERIDMQLLDASIKGGNVIKERESDAFNNYYYAHCPEGITNVRSYKKITIRNVYEAIDWVLYLNKNEENKVGIKYDFVVHPGANINAIKFKYTGPESMTRILEQKKIEVRTQLGSITDDGLVSFSGNKKVDTDFKIGDNGTFGFKINEDYDRSKPLVIDPALIWSTYYGGTDNDGGEAITSDGTNVFVTGFTISRFGFFPLNPGGGAYYKGFLGPAGSPDDAFILKFNTSGVKQWATYYGGTGTDAFYGAHTDGTTFWTCGFTTSTNFPVQNPGGGAYFDNSLTGSSGGTIAKFVAATGVRQWATYYDGGNFGSIQYDGTSLWVAGSGSSGFSTLNPGGGAYHDGTVGGTSDAAIIKFNNAGVRQWATFYGGTNSSEGFTGLYSDGSSIWLTGGTNSTNFPTFNPGGGAYYDNTSSTSGDGIIVKFNTSGVRQWATYYGGNSFEQFRSLHGDGSNIWVAGYTRSSNFATLNPGGGSYFDGTKTSAATSYDGFILKFNAAGVRQWATYYGGANGTEALNEVHVDNSFVWVVGSSSSSDFNTMNQTGAYYDNTVSGTDAVIMQFDKSNALQWSTFVGGTSSDNFRSVFSDGTSVWATGITFSTNYPTLDPGGGAHYDATLGGPYDALITQFDGGSPCGACSAGGSGTTWTWTGCLGTSWFDPCNWDRQSVPTTTSDVVIPNTSNKPLITGATADCNTINIQSSSGARLDLNSSGGGVLNITQ